MSCGCEIRKMMQDLARVRGLAMKAAGMTGDTYVIYQDEQTKEYHFCPEDEANERKIIEYVI